MAKKDIITPVAPIAPPVDETELAEGEEGEEGEEGWDEEDEEEELVTLVDEDGKETDFVFLAVVDMDEEGRFAVLTPAEEDEASESTEVFLFHYDEDEDGAEIFEPIEDEALFTRVQAAAEKMFSEMDEGEEGVEHDHAGHDHKHGHEE